MKSALACSGKKPPARGGQNSGEKDGRIGSELSTVRGDQYYI
jgi:hypothetical protein